MIRRAWRSRALSRRRWKFPARPRQNRKGIRESSRVKSILICRGSGSALGFDEDVNLIGAAIPEIEANAAVGELRDCRRYGTGGEIPARGQNYGVSSAAKAAIEDEFVAIEAIADRRGVSFRNP